MRVLVTGGAGFLGSHLCRTLLHGGTDVLCVDDFSTGSRANIADLLEHPRFELIEHDLIQPLHVDAERVLHFACPASPVAYQRNPVRTVKTNVLGTINMLGLAKRTGARILLAGTSEVYGNPTRHPQDEEYLGNVNQLGPRACYDEGKRVAETLMMDYHREHGVDVRLARIFNTYGPGMGLDDGRVVSNFIRNALTGKPLQLYGGGSQSRSFCYVSDMVDGVLRLLEYEGPLRHAPFNLGNPHEITVRELADEVLALTGSSAGTVDHPLPWDDPSRRCPDITRARTELGFAPGTDLTTGLQATIKDIQARLGSHPR
jgi:UDP-glucuronate decarboxylase